VRELIDRMRALEHHVADASAARRVEFEGGVAYFNDDLPHVWDLNIVRLDRPCPAPALQVDRLQAGLAHRKVLIEEPHLVERFGPGLVDRGLNERGLVALAREPGGTLDPAVRQTPIAQVREFRTRMTRELIEIASDEAVEQLVAASEVAERAGGHWLVLFEGDEPAASCIVFSHDGLAQIEDVSVLGEFQGRGLSRRLMGHALEHVAGAHDTVMIIAEAEAWPLGFYQRLGFERVEERADYTLVLAEG